MGVELATVVSDFAEGMKAVDLEGHQAVSTRSGSAFLPGIGPHTEARTVELVMRHLAKAFPERYAGFGLGIPYPEAPRQKCDLCLGSDPPWEWAIEIKMARFLGDNGKVNDNILMHLLSPYPQHRSALTDSEKLIHSSLGRARAILIYGFDHDDWNLDPAIEAFETLAGARVRVGKRFVASFDGLIHPVHKRGRVFAWELGSGAQRSGRNET